ncbi:unnamed protein product [Rotaria sp. Silwood2]|nr:unnamed protein product [Rotaria sp. Silwood2]CAF4528944.1 unnamed protein product [Rotaria sp. Silwood2]
MPLQSPFQCPRLLSQTCLKSYDASTLRKTLYHSSMVHNTAPATLSFWVQNKTGFEIGGPSHHTWGTFGVYDIATKVDVTNFAANTLWESGLTDDSPFIWNKQPKGKQYIRDAVDLKGIPDEYYDFVLASHVLEHIANPFKGLLEWIRITRSHGVLLLLLPFKEHTFDHKRDIDRLEHLINDYHNQTSEADLSHLNEIVRLHDLAMDPPAGNINTFRERSEKNFQNRGLHQHVYDQELLYYIFICLNLDVKAQFTWNIHQLIIGQKR